MTAFRLFLVASFIVLFAYTGLVVAEHGLGLLPVFFGDIAAMGWPGQFNLDFMLMLALSALWTAWRGGFSPASLGLGVLAFFFGAGFLTVFLLVLSFVTGGDLRRMLLGVHA